MLRADVFCPKSPEYLHLNQRNYVCILENTLISSFVVILKVVRYVWNEAKPNIDQIEKKQINISIKEPQDF